MTLDDPISSSKPFPDACNEICWPIAMAAMPLFRRAPTGIFFQGIIGANFRSTTAPAIYADLQALYVPGLRCFGIEASVLALPECLDEPASLRQPVGVPVFRFEGEPFQDDAYDEGSADGHGPEAAARPAAIDRTRRLSQSGLVREATPDYIVWEDRTGTEHSEPRHAFCEKFSRIVKLTSAGKPASRRAGLLAAIQRVTVFALAYPDRFLTDADEDAGVRADASVFLAEAGGNRRDPISRRWRRAGEYLREGDVQAALDQLHDATLLGLALPKPLYAALASPREAPLTDLQHRELIYLARAGNRDFKVLATHRLAGEPISAVVRNTLEQLTTNLDPLVRAAATAALSPGCLREIPYAQPIP